MTLLNFDFTQVDPNFSGGSFLPVSDDKGWLVVLNGDNGFKQASSGQGYYLELVGKGQDAAVANMDFTLRLNLQHAKPQAVAAAYAQLAALGIVCGLPGRVADTSELFNKPFRLVSVKQKDSEYTNLADNGIRFADGSKPARGGQGAQTAQPAPQIPQAPPAAPAMQAAPAPAFQPAPGQPAMQPGAPAQPGWTTGPAAQAPMQAAPAPAFGAPGGAPAFQPPAFGGAPAGPAPGGPAPAWVQTPGR